jgi:putative transposase
LKNGTSNFIFCSVKQTKTKKGDAMSDNIKNVTEFLNNQPLESLSIDEIARIGAQQMLKQALVAEFQAYIDQHKDSLIEGKSAVVKNGYHKERSITVGSGQVAVKVPRSRSRKEGIDEFSSAIVPKYIRRSLKIEEAIPLLYLRGISTNNMYPALEKLLGPNVSGLSASNVSKLKNCWSGEYRKWKNRSLADNKYCYLWVDGIHANVRFSDDKLCILVVIGAKEDGEKELVAVNSGYRESTES